MDKYLQWVHACTLTLLGGSGLALQFQRENNIVTQCTRWMYNLY